MGACAFWKLARVHGISVTSSPVASVVFMGSVSPLGQGIIRSVSSINHHGLGWDKENCAPVVHMIVFRSLSSIRAKAQLPTHE